MVGTGQMKVSRNGSLPNLREGVIEMRVDGKVRRLISLAHVPVVQQ